MQSFSQYWVLYYNIVHTPLSIAIMITVHDFLSPAPLSDAALQPGDYSNEVPQS